MEFSQLVERLQPQLQTHSLEKFGDRNPTIGGVASLMEALPGQISYVDGAKYAPQMEMTRASALILPLDAKLQAQADDQGIAWCATAQPRLLFAAAIAVFYQPYRPPIGIHPTAVIDSSVRCGQDVSIGPHVVIYPDVTIGDRVCVHGNVVIYPGVTIGNDTILHGNCTIHERTQIGQGCVIHSGAAIGAEGFGFVPTPEGWFKMEQSGQVVLEDGVEIGCNSAVDRPAVGETRIGKNTKLDNMVHVAHGCRIGEACALAGQVGLAGGVTIGNRVILAGQVGVADKSDIGDGAIASAQTGIHGKVGAREVVCGSPHMPHRLYLKASAIYKRLPEMYDVLKKLKKI
ncbi:MULTISPECIES: UDP-3-O-(3-hydroxymyristoyl)glucosamine N-acyltransferase [unclassified Synechocystis]|uniref:UDP-3-O-(3-hydroxymyristoyl)glucosamine N-acyltransferase n=1 Tax=unclassified Synechocystis TaxID=2640012 RepID=UPI000410E8ED|nr:MULTISPECIES: UDP-3-O-(3-hydroxymyristoyl)glucosamine N-acyltransferase [unclassified Synechocystis]AIE74522.1 UDP-3-O-[3-hydroxymyristoyl] glucosamine N-acyltransferase [Synechocystis sp. PCC 6714]MCT0254721.1 UDP-3-O-(3-hydroxymyristoyl)glucosamine N-acyltransferase [Synechocystis sp. CS-94]